MKLNALLGSPVIVCWVAFVPTAYSVAQQAEESPAFRIQVDTNKVLVPVVVRDRQGRVLVDLKREDFQVFDDGKPRAVSGFSVEKRVEIDSGAGKDMQLAAHSTASAGARTLASARFIVFLFDDMHLSFEDLAHAKAAGSRLLNGAFADADVTAVISMSRKVNTGLTQSIRQSAALVSSRTKTRASL